MATTPYEHAINSTRAVLTGIGPDQLDAATPCASWKVSDLVNHVVGGQYMFHSALQDQPPSAAAPDFAAGDFVASFDEGAAQAVAAFQAEGVMDRIVRLPFGELPGSQLLYLAATDTFVHGWDLAKATGQPTDLAPELAAQLLDGAHKAIHDSMRGPDGAAPFGPEQKAPEGAGNADQLAAFLGRTV
jgi:uncharacterized protein (TIGR03086 family)